MPGKHARMAGSAGLWPECTKLQPTTTITAQKNLQLSMIISYMVIPCSSMFRWLGTYPLRGTEIWRATIPLHGHTTVARISLHVQLLGFNRSESLASIQPEGWLLWFHVVEEAALRLIMIYTARNSSNTLPIFTISYLQIFTTHSYWNSWDGHLMIWFGVLNHPSTGPLPVSIRASERR